MPNIAFNRDYYYLCILFFIAQILSTIKVKRANTCTYWYSKVESQKHEISAFVRNYEIIHTI